MARSRWPLWIAAGVALVWGGGKAFDWYSSSYAENAAHTRVAGLFTNLQADGDPTLAVAMWVTGSMDSGGRQLEQSLWNAEYARMMSWMGEKGLRTPISRFEIVGAAIPRNRSQAGSVIVTVQVDGQTLFVRAIDGRALEWASSAGE